MCKKYETFQDYLKINNTRLFYSVKGEGEPLVLTHGGPFCDHRIWDYQIESLASKYKVNLTVVQSSYSIPQETKCQ